MMPMIILVLATCGLAYGSGVGNDHFVAAPLAAAPVAAGPPFVAALSSQYFERNFNRLVAAPLAPQPVIPVHQIAHVHPIAPPPQVFVESARRQVPIPVNPTQHELQDPNVAIAIATAHAAAPVATIILPPYPFAPPPTFGYVHPIAVPMQGNESSTALPTTVPQTTVKEPEATTPSPSPQPQASNKDNSFAQPLPTNKNTNFPVQQQYGPPQNVLPLQPKPLKLKTSVEVQPVPLRYIAPPPIPHHHHHHHHHHGHHPTKYVHTFVPAKLIVRSVHVHTVRVPAKQVVHKVPVRNGPRYQQQVLRPRIDSARDTEPTTFTPFRPVTKPPRFR